MIKVEIQEAPGRGVMPDMQDKNRQPETGAAAEIPKAGIDSAPLCARAARATEFRGNKGIIGGAIFTAMQWESTKPAES